MQWEPGPGMGMTDPRQIGDGTKMTPPPGGPRPIHIPGLIGDGRGVHGDSESTPMGIGVPRPGAHGQYSGCLPVR
jgi:hypothetical protein